MDGLRGYLSNICRQVWKNVIQPHQKFYELVGLFSCISLFILFAYKAFELARTFEPNLTAYPYLNPPVFLSVGEAIASVAILLAVYQFRKDRGSISLKIRSYVLPTTVTSMVCGLLLTFFSPFILIEQPSYIFQLSIFWQIAAGVLIIFSIVFLFLKTTNKNLFTKNSAANFYHVLVSELSRPSDERIQTVLQVFLENFDQICSAAKGADTTERSYARALLDVVLGESSMVDIISTKRLDALHYILYTIKKYDLNQQQVRGLHPIIKNLFRDHGSYFYQHLSTNGLALSSNLYDQIFGSPVIINNFGPFGYPSMDYLMANATDEEEIEVVIKALSTAIATYLKTGVVSPRNINEGLSHVSKIFGSLCHKIRRGEENGITKQALENDWWSLHTIAHFLAHDYAFLVYQDILNEEIVEKEKTAREASFYSAETINAGIAAALYKGFEHLAMTLSSENIDDVYHTVLDLMHGMMYEYDYKTGYRPPFEEMLWGQIKRNVEERTYPAVLPVFLSFMGLSLASDDEGKGWEGEQEEMLRRLLYIDLKPLLDLKEKMVNKKAMEEVLLPSYMKYEGGKFTYTMGFGEGTTKVIAEPVAGSSSVLAEVTLGERMP